MEQDPTFYLFSEQCRRASECHSMACIPPTCTYCHRVGHITEDCFVERKSEAVENENVCFKKNSELAEARVGSPFGRSNITLVK